jgi:hypothetical protein
LSKAPSLLPKKLRVARTTTSEVSVGRPLGALQTLKPDDSPQPPSPLHPTDLDLLVAQNRSKFAEIIKYRLLQLLATLSDSHGDSTSPFFDIETFTGVLENFTGRAHDAAATISALSLFSLAFTNPAHDRLF